jgi:hypothetical protein
MAVSLERRFLTRNSERNPKLDPAGAGQNKFKAFTFKTAGAWVLLPLGFKTAGSLMIKQGLFQAPAPSKGFLVQHRRIIHGVVVLNFPHLNFDFVWLHPVKVSRKMEAMFLQC